MCTHLREVMAILRNSRTSLLSAPSVSLFLLVTVLKCSSTWSMKDKGNKIKVVTKLKYNI